MVSCLCGVLCELCPVWAFQMPLSGSLGELFSSVLSGLQRLLLFNFNA